MTKIKVCGITSLIDAHAAVAAGADALGFNFYPASVRYVSPAEARAIVQELPSSVVAVGVFVNVAEPQAVIDAVASAGIGVVQLHGEESPDYCRQLATRPVIKALRVRNDFQADVVRDYATDAILLDTYSPRAAGGTGEQFDWSVALQVQPYVKKLYLAGGLHPGNVAEAIRLVRPYAVDVCSGVESTPGLKDHDLLRRFVERVLSAE